MIYTMNGMATAAAPAGRYARQLRRPVRALQRRRVLRHAVQGRMRCDSQGFDAWVAQARGAGRKLDGATYAALTRQSSREPVATYGDVDPELFERIVAQELPPGPGPATERGGATERRPPPTRAGSADMFGKLTLGSHSVPRADRDDHLGRGRRSRCTAILAWIVIKGHLPYLWKEWLTSVDHKRIGVMYVVLAHGDAVARLRRRDPHALAAGDGVWARRATCRRITTTRSSSAHGTMMIFFVAMPFVIGLMNFVVPLQLGARDVAFPALNSVGFWLTATGALLVNISLIVGEFARTGWLPIRRCRSSHTRPGWASTTTCGRCRYRASGRCCRGHQPRDHGAEGARAGHDTTCACRCSAGPRSRPTC